MEADSGWERGRKRKVWQEWQGNFTFFCNGHLVAGPHWPSLIGTALLIIIPNGVFLGFVAWDSLKSLISPAFFAVGIALASFCLAQLFLTGCKDPGVIPRQPSPSTADSPHRFLPRTKEVSVPSTGRSVTVRWNESTNFYQPPRAHHCSVNDDCIERFDHHCPWVGTTIGRRNYRNFLLFVYGSVLMSAFVFTSCVFKVELVRRNDTASGSNFDAINRALSNSPVAIAIMAIAFLAFLFTATLGAFHAYLISSNQTTYENFRYNFDSRSNPYNRGCVNNCLEVWGIDASRRNVDFLRTVDEQRKAPVPALAPVKHLWSIGSSSNGEDGDDTRGTGGPLRSGSNDRAGPSRPSPSRQRSGIPQVSQQQQQQQEGKVRRGNEQSIPSTALGDSAHSFIMPPDVRSEAALNSSYGSTGHREELDSALPSPSYRNKVDNDCGSTSPIDDPVLSSSLASQRVDYDDRR
jgi:palmitoyltransferase ZDHHC9/14/18